MRILLAKRRALGDTVLLASTVELLAKSLPGSEISVLVPEAFSSVFEGNPFLKRVYSYEEGWLGLLAKIRREKFDYFFQLHASPNTRWLAWASGAKCIRLHYQNAETEKAYGKHPNALEWDPYFLRQTFPEKIRLQPLLPKIFLSAKERIEGEEFWQKWGVKGREVVFFGLGASRSTKRWPPEHFARLAELFRERAGLFPAIVTGPGEEEERFAGLVVDHFRAKGLRPLGGVTARADENTRNRGDFIHSSGLSVRELTIALSAVRAYIGSDSGPKHLALATGAPTYTFFGPEDPVEWHPYPLEEHPVFFLPGLSCRGEDNGRWCGIQECKVERHRCMVDIDPDEVFVSIQKRLEQREKL